MRFDGTNDSLTMADNDALDNLLIAGQSSLTFFVVGKHDKTSGADGAIWNKYSATGITVAYYLTGGVLYDKYFTSNASGVYEARNGTDIDNTLKITLITYTTTPSISFYNNGALDAATVMTNTGTGNYTGNAGAVYVGSLAAGSKFLKGDIYLLGCIAGLDLNGRSRLTQGLSDRFQMSVTLAP
jgi:hypothetical protein